MKHGARPAASPAVTDAELLRAVAEGDLAPLGELYDRYARDVWRAVRRTLDGPADVEDVVHATFLGLQRIAASYDGRLSCRGWLCGIGVRLAMRRRRGLGRFHRMLGSLAQAMSGSRGTDPERHASDRQELRALDQAVAQLTPKKRAVFVLVELEGLTPDQAARALDIPPATARTRLFHARRELKAALRPGGEKP